MDNSHTKKVANHWGGLWKDREEKEYFEKESKLFIIKYKLKVFKKIFSQLPTNAKVLEIGCGDSFWPRMLKKHYPKIKLYGLDISDEAIRISKKHGVNAVKGDVRKAPFKDDSFDLVFSFGVVEHFPGTKKAILEHIRITKPGGISYIETPSKYSLLNLEYFIGDKLFHHRTFEEHMITNGIRYSHSELVKMANAYSGKIIVNKISTGPVLPLYKFMNPLDNFIPKFIRNRIGGSSGIVVKKIK